MNDEWSCQLGQVNIFRNLIKLWFISVPQFMDCILRYIVLKKIKRHKTHFQKTQNKFPFLIH